MTENRSCRRLIIPFLLLLLFTQANRGLTSENKRAVAIEATRRSTLTGFTRARAKIKVVSEVSDRLLEIKNDIGSTIGKDGVLAVIDSTMAELDLESNLLLQKKVLSKTSYLEKEVKRFATLLKNQSTAEAKFDSLEQELDQARLALKELQNNEKKAREVLSRHTVKAPSGWKVISRSAEPGEWVSTGKVLAEIGDYRTLTVPFALGQQEYSWLQKNSERLTLWLPELGIHVDARILRVSPGFDEQTRKLNLELEITGKIPERRGGIRAELNIETPDPSGAILIPEEALSSRYDSFWLTSLTGERIPVVKLGPGPTPGTVRISSAAIRPGDSFLIINPSEKNDSQ